MTTVTHNDTDIQKLLIEVTNYGSEETGLGGQVLDATEEVLERTQATIKSVAERMVKTIQSVDKAITPDEFKLKFSIKFRADGSVLVASSSAEGAIEIQMVYKHKN